jgi:hypothetical protein
MFKDHLKTIFGQRVWPGYDALSAELHTYAEATQRVNELKKDNNDGKISANVAKATEKQGGRACFNCGSPDHNK